MRRRELIALLGGAALVGCGDSQKTASPDTSHIVTNPTYHCATNRIASINASDETFTLTGTCETVFVNGASNKITIEASKTVVVDGARNVMKIVASDKVIVNGAGNTVRFKKGLTGKTSAVTAIGDNNTLIQEN